jgi:excisionase family DNA binding protein
MPDSPSASSITRASAIALPGPLLVTVRQACQMLGLGRTSVDHFITTGRLRQVRIGGAVRFSVDHLREFVETQAAECL